MGVSRSFVVAAFLAQECTWHAASSSTSTAFWNDMRGRGLLAKINASLAREETAEGALSGADLDGPAQAAQLRPSPAVVSKDVFYGRPILRIPEEALMGLSLMPLETRKSIQEQLVGLEAEQRDLLTMAYALVLERRKPQSVFREWLEVAGKVAPPALDLSVRQLLALAGTTVEDVPEKLMEDRDLIKSMAGKIPCFAETPVTREEATFALSAIVRHAVPAVDAEGNIAKVLPPLSEILAIPRHPNHSMAAPLMHSSPSQARVLVQTARKDLRSGEEAIEPMHHCLSTSSAGEGLSWVQSFTTL